MTQTVRSFHLRHEPTSEQLQRVPTRVLSEHYDQVLASSARIYSHDGKLLAVLLRDALALQSGGSMYRAISPILKVQARTKKLSEMQAGLWETADGYAPSSFTSVYPRAAERCSAALNHLSAIYKAYMPDAYGYQDSLLQNAKVKRWALQGSIFTSLRMELNSGGNYRHDAEHPIKAARVLWCFRGGKAKLSHLVLPKRGLALTLDSLDVVLLTADEPFGITAIKDGPEPYERIVCEGTLRGALP